MTLSGLAVRIWNGTKIRRRDQDGYINATAMCQANGKRWSHYASNERSKEYICALAGSAGIPADLLIDSITTGANPNRGTWIHPRLAVDLARWISPQFAVWMDGWFLESLQAAHQPAGELGGPNGRIDLALTLLHEAIATIDPGKVFRPTDCDIFVNRRGPAVHSTPLRSAAVVDLPFSTVRRVRVAAV
jgi:hypothetical protein